MVRLVEVGTHAIIDAATGPYSTSEPELSRELLGRLQPGMLCLADRGFHGFAAWQAASASGADLLWRMRSSQRLDPLELLPDGSYLSTVYEGPNCKHRGDGLSVRVIARLRDVSTRGAATGVGRQQASRVGRGWADPAVCRRSALY